MLDDDALQALWSVYDACGVRPEYLIPVLQLESGLDPTRQNAAGAPVYGIAQTSAANLARLGLTPAQFLGLTAGAQIRAAVLPYFASAVQTYGPIRSATRAMQANLVPATLPTVRGLSQFVARGGTAVYTSNVVLDPLHHGAILLSDLALVMARSADAPPAAASIARAYVLRPSAAPPLDAVYGQDFVNPAWGLGAVAVAIAFALR